MTKSYGSVVHLVFEVYFSERQVFTERIHFWVNPLVGTLTVGRIVRLVVWDVKFCCIFPSGYFVACLVCCSWQHPNGNIKRTCDTLHQKTFFGGDLLSLFWIPTKITDLMTGLHSMTVL